MKAICIKEPGKVEIQEIAKPERKPGEALLKLLYGGICGSDLGSYRGTNAYVSYPRIPGHEFSAEIVEIDENEEGLKPGGRLTSSRTKSNSRWRMASAAVLAFRAEVTP